MEEALHGLNQGIHAALSEVDAFLPFQVGDDAIDGTGAERVPTDEKRVKGEGHAQVWIAKVARDKRIHTALHSQVDQFGQDTYIVTGIQERLLREIDKGALVDAPGGCEEGSISGDIARCKACDLLL